MLQYAMFELLHHKLSIYTPATLPSDLHTRASVLIPLYEVAGETRIVLTKRSAAVQYHKGEISFPGGMYEDEDGDSRRTALRECREEIGVKENDITILGRMDDMQTITGFVITPYAGLIPYPYHFILNLDEVEYLIHLPLNHLMHVPPVIEPVPYKDKLLEVPAIYYGDERIFGATCRLLLKLKALLLDETL